jgi:hypothetical protein
MGLHSLELDRSNVHKKILRSYDEESGRNTLVAKWC